MNKHIYIFLCLSIACAQIRSPTGGERDEESPLIEEMIPNNGSVNFKGKSILITFDEYVKLNNIREQLLISPPLSKQPEVSIKGKSVIVKWDEELKENSTYTFSFGEGIVDNNESNKLDSNKVVFSTGPKLDSLSLSGTVVDAYTREALSCAVLLHRANVDSAITNELPYYYGLSKKDGSFRFDNLKEGNYQLFALKDQDKNYKWTENELMAFYSDTISLGYQDSTLYELNVFRKKPDELSIKRYEASNIGKVEIVLNMEVDELSFEAIQFTYDKVFVDRIKPDSLVYWFDGIVPQENCALKILRANEILDTISVYAFESDKKREYPELGLNVNGVLKQNPKQKLQLFSNTPIKELDEEKIILKMDSTVAKADLSLKEFNLIEFANNWSNFRYGQLTMLPGAITDIFGQSNDSIDARIKVLGESDFGVFNLRLEIDKKANYQLEVFSDQKLVKSIKVDSSKLYNWDWFPSGKVSLRLIEDINDNGSWDSGDYFESKQAERVWVLSEDVYIRPNWVLDQEWIISNEE